MISKDPRSTSTAGVSLNKASALLEKALGARAPARITLHRHSASGILDSMVVRKSATRRYFSAEALIRFYQGRLPANVEGPTETQQPAKAPKATDHTTDTRPLISTEEIASQLVQRVGPLIANEVAQALAPIASMLRRIDGGLNDLASTRTTLMLKYDAEATQHAQRLEEAKAEIRRLKGLSDQDQQLQRIRLDISRLLDTIAQMQNRDE